VLNTDAHDIENDNSVNIHGLKIGVKSLWGWKFN